ncbi:BZ3500_MvSof-1268-A1-R1_Chr7-1g09078 [Microbotryum saponariae]|uniref:BZ3500_MvSof-1268-A1-R1_Chr7-1g09078 protein n=1 Tax=Microbotryum saponariae TaxID=289078 RepID=A0A2X0LH78_9BASI|nr:BZ3501_MvSof-1269-A2-R1_Chr7-1g08782 [Microbotryum saponariae]SDA02755.1 BZ3500_MvSof-1268-A1-R1_Chr7-1g09078 [Microbotryum saponariae]
MRSSTTKLLVVLSTWAFIGVQALDVVYPTAPVVFDQSGAIENRIVWSLTPLTNPPPATNFFDIWMRNGIGEIYPDALNVSIFASELAVARRFEKLSPTRILTAHTPRDNSQVSIASNLDMTNPNMTYVWPDAAKYVPGPGYQLFFSAPGNASLVYCDSKVFSIGSTTYNASHTTYTGPFVALQPSSTSPASATEPATETMTGSAATSAAVMLTTTSSAAQAVETTTVTNTLSASPTPTTVSDSSFITSVIPASAKPTATPATASVVLANSKPSSSSGPVATDYAGPAGQGFNLLSSSGMILNVRRAGMGLVVVATTVFIVA